MQLTRFCLWQLITDFSGDLCLGVDGLSATLLYRCPRPRPSFSCLTAASGDSNFPLAASCPLRPVREAQKISRIRFMGRNCLVIELSPNNHCHLLDAQKAIGPSKTRDPLAQPQPQNPSSVTKEFITARSDWWTGAAKPCWISNG